MPLPSPRRLAWRFVLSSSWLVLTVACAKRSEAPVMYAEADMAYAMPASDSRGMAEESDRQLAAASMPAERGRSAGATKAPAAKRAGPRPSAPPPPPAPPPGGPSSSPTAVEAAAEPAAERMVHYEGWLRLRVIQPDKSVDALTAYAASVGGHLEQANLSRVVIRVPVARFEEAVKEVSKLGELTGKQISADDVTDAFTATDLRLRTATATRSRLVALLAKATESEEKLMLVAEIQRVSEDIERLEASLRTLGDLAAYSRITIELVQRPVLSARSGADEAAGMRWLSRLSPFSREVGQGGKRLELDVPAGLVSLHPRGPFVAESADGARVWTGRLKNDPEGDSAFWMEAVARRLGPDFATAERSKAGGYELLRLVDRSDEPYVYLIAVRALGRHLDLVEVYFPTQAHEQRYGAAVQAALVGSAS